MNDHTNIIGICMGTGRHLARAGLRRAAPHLRAATPGEETPRPIAPAPDRDYRIDQSTRPPRSTASRQSIRNSLSPIMMNTAFAGRRSNAVYLALQTNR